MPGTRRNLPAADAKAFDTHLMLRIHFRAISRTERHNHVCTGALWLGSVYIKPVLPLVNTRLLVRSLLSCVDSLPSIVMSTAQDSTNVSNASSMWIDREGPGIPDPTLIKGHELMIRACGIFIFARAATSHSKVPSQTVCVHPPE